MSLALAEFTKKLVPISDFSQGKAGKIFSDVADNNSEYIVLKNNQPTAVVISIEEYRVTQEKLAMFEKMMERVENMRLLKLAESRGGQASIEFEDIVAEEGFSMEELLQLAECVEFE
ncbi:MAG: type II toxin-antitoxin system Phd/YefM family antitoxin [Lachnospira sp.]|nr:type II toxin-antitoxin system Phd/YefM family antitoxin [Lachnospira sp.]